MSIYLGRTPPKMGRMPCLWGAWSGKIFAWRWLSVWMVQPRGAGIVAKTGHKQATMLQLLQVTTRRSAGMQLDERPSVAASSIERQPGHIQFHDIGPRPTKVIHPQAKQRNWHKSCHSLEDLSMFPKHICCNFLHYMVCVCHKSS